jgi:myo-inositol-1(or 4)-monophosphatase
MHPVSFEFHPDLAINAMHPTVTIALRAARDAAEKITYTLGQQEWPISIEERERMLNGLKIGINKRLQAALKQSHPDQRVISTEGDDYEPEKPQANVSWQLAPILGEANLMRGLPECGVLLSQWQNDRMEHLAMVFPALELEVVASRGRGLHINGRRARVGNHRHWSSALVGTDPQVGPHFQQLLAMGASVRVSGCAMIDMIRTLTSYLDATYHINLSELEIHASLLLSGEAGALTGEVTGAPLSPKSKTVVCANPVLFRDAMQWFRQAEAQ